VIGAVLDRNGLRPSRYVVTKDGFVVMASEVGVLEHRAENVEHKDRLQPGACSSSTPSRAASSATTRSRSRWRHAGRTAVAGENRKR
jgi:hypothetical protein